MPEWNRREWIRAGIALTLLALVIVFSVLTSAPNRRTVFTAWERMERRVARYARSFHAPRKALENQVVQARPIPVPLPKPIPVEGTMRPVAWGPFSWVSKAAAERCGSYFLYQGYSFEDDPFVFFAYRAEGRVDKVLIRKDNLLARIVASEQTPVIHPLRHGIYEVILSPKEYRAASRCLPSQPAL